MNLAITASAYPETQEAALRVSEALTRAAVGLALEGIAVTVSATPLEEEDASA